LKDASQLHDIGKIGISDSILSKPGPLTPSEVEVMKQHPGIGESILRPLKTFQNLLHPIRHHHEFLDGSGYPDGLRGNEIPIITRILSVADIFDAMTSGRPYREALGKTEALNMLSGLVREGKIDPQVVSALHIAITGNEHHPDDTANKVTDIRSAGTVHQIHEVVSARHKAG